MFLTYISFMAGPTIAESPGNIGGTIPSIRSIDSVIMDDSMTNSFCTVIAVEDYNAGYKESADAATTVTVTANTAWEVTIAVGSPDGYFTISPTGSGNTPRPANHKPISELLLKVNTIRKGTDTNATMPTIDGEWDGYTPLTYTAQNLVSCTSGNDSANWDMQYKMMLDTSKDTPGVYSCEITYRIQAITD